MSDTLPFSEAKARLSALADRVERQHDRILVTRNGRPSFMMMSPDDLESLEETIDILSDDELIDEGERLVIVHRIQHRRNVYRPG